MRRHLFFQRVLCRIGGLPRFRFLVSERKYYGFTLIELLVVMVILGALATIAIPSYYNTIEKARVTKAIAEIRVLETEIFAFQALNERFPDSLAEIGRASLLDPWENPYEYVRLTDITGKGKARKNKFMNPLNTDFDLYSMGKDGDSKLPVQNPVSHDDVLRADNGRFVGLASEI